MNQTAMNLKELSSRLGLSQTTVSRALNGFPEVSEETRERVVAAARRFGYKPSRSAASLATGKAFAIGHVIPMSAHDMINPHFADFIAGAGQIYAEHDYEMLIRMVPTDKQADVYRQLAAQRRVDGVVVHGPLDNDPRIDLLNELGMPFIVHGRSDGASVAYDYIDVNNRTAFKRATQFLLELGHTDIALLNGLETMNFAKRRREGYVEALKAAGIVPNPAWMASADMVTPYGYSAALEMLSSTPAPTAFLVSSVLIANGVARAIADNGLRVGKDISLITFDDCLSYEQPESGDFANTPPFFTSMRSSIRTAGIKAAQLLMDKIERPDDGPRKILWDAQFVLGASTGPAPRH